MTILSSGNLSPYGILQGQLFLYASTNLAAFESSSPPPLPPPPITGTRTRGHEQHQSSKQEQQQQQEQQVVLCPNKCILLGGLSDGLLPTPYTESLDRACGAANWSLVQPILSSSYTGFGHGRLQRDVQELDQLLAYLLAHRQAQRIALIGHSTGCQDIVHYLKYGQYASKVCCAVLQAPVSDREHAVMEDPVAYQTNLQLALELQQQGKAEEMMPRSAFWAPITAQRFLDLQQRGGMDDYFSSDYTIDEQTERLGHVGDLHDTLKCCLVAYSGADEYVPSTVDTRALTDRLVQAMNARHTVAQALYLPTGNHNLSEGANDTKIFVDRVAQLLGECLN